MTAHGQSRLDIFDFIHNGTAYVGIRASAWEDVVAKRLKSNDLNSMRVRSIMELKAEVAAADNVAESYKSDAEECNERFALAMGEIKSRDETIAKRERKIDRLRPWATGAKVVVGLVVLGAIGKGVNAIVPGTIPIL